MEYQILASSTLDDLEQRVHNAISDGWKPQGGVTSGGAGAGAGNDPRVESQFQFQWVFAQAMVKD